MSKELKDYDSINAEQFIINSWYAPYITEESLQTYKDCGFNYIFLIGDNSGSIGDCNIEKCLNIADKLGIKVMVDCTKQLDYIKKTQDIYIKHPSFAGFNYDEPVIYKNTLTNSDGIVDIRPYVLKMHEEHKEIPFLINLNPLTSIHFPWGTPKFTYDEYLDKQIECINSIFVDSNTTNWLSCDDYPLFYDKKAENKYYLKPTWLENLEYLSIRKRDSKFKLKTNFFIQTMPYGDDEAKRDRVPTYEDIRLQVYTLLAFGYDSASYFCYFTPPIGGEFFDYQLAIVDRENKPTKIYYDSKKVNEEIKKISNTYMQFNSAWYGVLTILGTNNTSKDESYSNDSFDLMNAPLSIENIKEIKDIESSEDIIIGCFKDSDSVPGFIIVNYNDTSLKKEVDSTITFSDFNKLLVYKNGEKFIFDLNDHKYTFHLSIGEGIFIIPFNN